MAPARRRPYRGGMFTRKIGGLLRGKATPLQVLLATITGSLLGFVPGFEQAPGLIVALVCLVLVANANLAMFGLTLLVTKLLAIVLLPVSYTIGTWLLDGPLEGLFAALVNGKVTAWFGFEYYAVTGGLVVGAAVGVLFGLVVNLLLRTIRARMAGVEANSERYQKFATRWWVRLCAWIFVGPGKGKQTWQQLSERKKLGLPIRVTGVVAAAALVALLWVFQSWLSTPLLTSGTRAGLESVNGATVDLERAELQLGDGTLRFDALAIADAAALDRDLFRADTLVATVDTGELLRRRLVIDELRASNARAGSPRDVPGKLITSDEPQPEPEPAPEGARTIEDYVEEFELWQQRFEQVQEWIEAIAGGDEPPADSTPEQREQQREQQEADGLAHVVAKHLLRETPRLVIRKIDIEGIGMSIDGEEDLLDLRLRNVSDAPSLLADVLSASLRAQSGTMDLKLTGPVAGTGESLGLAFAFTELSVDKLFSQLKVDGEAPVRGGTLELSATGSLGDVGSAMTVALPLQVKMKGATFAFSGVQPTKVDELLLPIGLSGSLTSPVVSLDDQALQQALVQAGQKELASFVQGQAGKLLGDVVPGGVPTDVDGAKDKVVDEAKKKLEDEANKLLPGGLNGLLPGGGKKKDK